MCLKKLRPHRSAYVAGSNKSACRTCRTGDCHNDSPRCSQRRHSPHVDDRRDPVHNISITMLTRAMFETPKYPRRPRDRYTAQIVNTSELSAPPPNRGKKIFNLIISLVKFQTTNTFVAAKKWPHCETVAL